MRLFLSILLIAAILSASAAVAAVLHGDALDQTRVVEQGSARQASQELEKTLQGTAFRLRSVAGLFEASEAVSAPEFDEFAAPLFDEQPALTAVLWMPRIADRQRAGYERAYGPITQGPPSARRRAATRAVYFPVTYSKNQARSSAPGFDGASESLRLAAIRRAIQRSRPYATAPVILAGSGKLGIVLYQPVFAGHAVLSQRTVQGVVAGTYRFDSLFASLRRSVPAGTTLQVRQDGTRILGAREIDGGEVSRVEVVGRSWTVRAASNQSPSLAVPAAVVLVGAALALLVTLMLRQAFTREGYAMSIVAARMSERDEALNQLEGARATAQTLAAEQAALRRVATAIAAEHPLVKIRETILTEITRNFGAKDAATIQYVGGHPLASDEPDWLAHPSVVRCDVRTGTSTRGTLALLEPAGHDGIEERLRDFADLAAVAITNADARRELAVRASSDGLTGLLNRRTFDERLEGEVSRAIRHGRPLTLAIIDIDHFKRVNDRHGHLAGDAVLIDVAKELSALARSGDAVARIGGEEFAWIMPETNLPAAFDVAERVRTAIAAADHADTTDLTISVGISELGDAPTGDALYGRADAALYDAKRSGRNRTIRHNHTQPLAPI